jgi:predicted acetyltransferase
MSTSIELRAIAADEIVAFHEAMFSVFGEDADADPDGPARIERMLPRSQVWAAFDRGAIVATAATFDLTLGVPGGALPMAGLTGVAVRPTHRRRGLLRALMSAHLADARARGYAISGLWASESSIYGRFGFGVASEGHAVEIQAAPTLELVGPLAGQLDELVFIDAARARRELPPVYQRALAARPGALMRSAQWWEERRFLEGSFQRHGASRLRHALALRGEEPVGYLQYRQRSKFEAGLPAGQLDIVELVGVDARAEATLWRLALRADLFPQVTWWNAPTDDLLPWIASDPRRVSRRRVDGLWLRIADVPAALAARRYAAPGTVHLAVEGAAWALTVGEDGIGHCEPIAPAAAKLQLTRQALGSLYLGGVPARQLARAGAIVGSAAEVAAAEAVLAWPVAPWCPELF